MKTLQNNFKSVSSLIGFGIALVLLGSYLRGWWMAQGIAVDIMASTVGFVVVGLLAVIEIRTIYQEMQSRPSKR